MNADEAPAFGAALHGAKLKESFRVFAVGAEIVGMDDITPFAVGAELKNLDQRTKMYPKWYNLFPENSHLKTERTISLKYGHDLHVGLFYEKSTPLPMDTLRDLGYYEVSGVSKAIKNYLDNEKYNIFDLPEIHLTFSLDANGIVHLMKATAEFTEWVIEGREHNEKTHRVDLNVRRFLPWDVMSMESADFESSEEFLSALDVRDRKTQDTADARNDLESYIFESRIRLHEDENLKRLCTEDEIEEFRDLLSEAEEWIMDHETGATAEIYLSKQRELKAVGHYIFNRINGEMKEL